MAKYGENDKLSPVHFPLTPEDRDKLKRLADADGRSVAAYTRRLVEQALARKKES